MLEIYIDGASSGNPGKAGAGFLIYEAGKLIKKESIPLGIQTNNFAEYMALIFALTEVLSIGKKECAVFSDSQLVCEQVKGNYKVRNENLRPLFIQVKELIAKLNHFNITHIPREKNSEADELAKEACEKEKIINKRQQGMHLPVFTKPDN